jgi:chemotaxis-related protein WspD
LFECPPPEDYIEDWTERVATIPEREDGERISVVVFRLDREWFALPTASLSEVVEARFWRRVPHRSGKEFLGLVTVRGELVPCFALSAFLGCAPPEADDRHAQILVCGEEGRRLAFPVDEVRGVERLTEGLRQSPPATVVRTPNAYARFLVESEIGRIAVLDAEQLFAAMETVLG